MATNVKLQYSSSSRSFTITIPVAVVKTKGWQGTYRAPPRLRAKKPDLPPDTDGTVLCIEDDPETGGIRLYPQDRDQRATRAADAPVGAPRKRARRAVAKA